MRRVLQMGDAKWEDLLFELRGPLSHEDAQEMTESTQ